VKARKLSRGGGSERYDFFRMGETKFSALNVPVVLLVKISSREDKAMGS
jgi:hypothetical protein